MGAHGIIAVMSACVLTSQAHMLMNTPKLYESPVISNGPLAADGSDFPCKLMAGQSLIAGSAAAANIFPQGSTQPLKFTGQAVHGGGSCQVSLSSDSAPNAHSKWKVIHSIVGGCPAKGQTGNMGNDANALDPDEYSFKIPSDIPLGNYSLAWSWLNKVGNREFYMNCAPVTITGSGGDVKNLDVLPDMFVANIAVAGSCGSTEEGSDVDFPNPGASVETLAGSTATAIKKPTCTGGSGSGSGSNAAPATVSASPAATVTSAAGGSGGGVFATGSSAKALVSVATSAAIPAATSGSFSSGQSGTGAGSSSGAASAGTTCSNAGDVTCLGASYIICASANARRQVEFRA
ncbi:hypothetical protein GQ53DRAFT_850409 [Thozetella sp. PMI_491]|nr:hypothetical protein GQ53DRAFT_850409 [Thozetella sp. PMI_491]